MSDITVRPMNEGDINQAADIHRKVIREGLGQSMNYAIEDLFKSFIKKALKLASWRKRMAKWQVL